MGDRTPLEAEVVALVEENAPLAARLAARYSRNLGNEDDLRQVAMTGLLLAARRYERAAGSFRPFAVATISGELKKYLRSSGWTVRVPRQLQERTIAVERATADLAQRLGRSPAPHEVGAETGLSVDEVLAALRATEARFGRELPTSGRSRDRIDQAIDPMAGVTDRLALAEAITHLEPDEARLLEWRYVEELTQRQIGERLGISQAQTHRRLDRLHVRLRALFGPENRR